MTGVLIHDERQSDLLRIGGLGDSGGPAKPLASRCLAGRRTFAVPAVQPMGYLLGVALGVKNLKLV